MVEAIWYEQPQYMDRYTGDTITPSRTIESEPRVGPGAYSPERTKSGARSTIGGKADDEARSNESAAFASTKARDLWTVWLDEYAC